MKKYDEYKVGDRVIVGVYEERNHLDTNNPPEATIELDVIAYCSIDDMVVIGSKDNDFGCFWDAQHEYKLRKSTAIRISNFEEYKYGWWAIKSDILILGKSSCITRSGGMHCKKCKDYYPYANSNQSDGSLICYGCREGLHTIFDVNV